MTAKPDIIPIIQDTREKQRADWLIRHPKVELIQRKLDEGDYSIEGYEDQLMIEHKRLGELCTNWTKERDRFRREWERAAAKDYLQKSLVIEGRKVDVLTHNYRSDFNPWSFLNTLASWKQRFHFDIEWLGSEDKWLEAQVTIYCDCKQFRRLRGG